MKNYILDRVDEVYASDDILDDSDVYATDLTYEDTQDVEHRPEDQIINILIDEGIYFEQSGDTIYYEYADKTYNWASYDVKGGDWEDQFGNKIADKVSVVEAIDDVISDELFKEGSIANDAVDGDKFRITCDVTLYYIVGGYYNDEYEFDKRRSKVKYFTITKLN